MTAGMLAQRASYAQTGMRVRSTVPVEAAVSAAILKIPQATRLQLEQYTQTTRVLLQQTRGL
jgi:hypothetical protein